MTSRAVFDCVVFLQGAARETGPAGACFRLMKEGAVTLCLSPQVLAEVSDVLTRPKSRQRFKTLTAERVQTFLQELRAKAVFFDAVPQVFTYPRDPDDEPYVNLALVAGARYLVTWDNDLLDLMNEATPEGKDFRQRFPNLAILNPVDFLQQLSPKEGQSPSAEASPS